MNSQLKFSEISVLLFSGLTLLNWWRRFRKQLSIRRLFLYRYLENDQYRVDEICNKLTHNFLSLQDLLMKSTLDSIFKVGFGFDLDTLSGSDEVSNQFMTAFDDSNRIIFWRYVDVLWRIKRYFNIGSEATLKKNIRVIDNFVYELIEHKREQMKNGKLDVRITRNGRLISPLLNVWFRISFFENREIKKIYYLDF